MHHDLQAVHFAGDHPPAVGGHEPSCASAGRVRTLDRARGAGERTQIGRDLGLLAADPS
jgi:hypothetical protein